MNEQCNDEHQWVNGEDFHNDLRDVRELQYRISYVDVDSEIFNLKNMIHNGFYNQPY
jgi:hypothetical protein